MNDKLIQGCQETLCIKVPKVYDWVTRQLDIPLQSFTGTPGLETLNFTCNGGGGSATGGPLVLMGIDAEDGGPGAHGPITVYIDVVNSILDNVSNGGSGILVIGGGKNPTDNVTTFWNAIGTGTGVPITYVNGVTNIMNQSFSGFSMLAVVSSVSETPSGGLTQAENDALATRQPDIATFINAGGGLFGLSQSGFTNPYAYLADVGAFSVNINLSYSDITPTPEGAAIGITDDLDVCCWHDEYITFPTFLDILATNTATGNAASIGGAQVIIGNDPCQILGQGGKLTAECILTDDMGNPVDPLAPSSILCTEIPQINGRQNVNFTLPDGETVTLQKVKVLKKGHFIVQVTNARGEICISSPQPFAVAEKFYLCAPEGTFLQCEITDFECDANIICTNNNGMPTFRQIDVSINMCQNVQMEATVKLEVTADFCQPRPEIPFDCPPLSFPPQCPEVFPGS